MLHVFRDCGLADFDPEFQKFSMDTGRAPERILPGRPDAIGSPSRLNDHQCFAPIAPESGGNQPKESIAILQPGTFSTTAEDLELMVEGHVLKNEGLSG